MRFRRNSSRRFAIVSLCCGTRRWEPECVNDVCLARELFGSTAADPGIAGSVVENGEVNNDDTGISGSSRKPETAIRANDSSLLMVSYALVSGRRCGGSRK